MATQANSLFELKNNNGVVIEFIAKGGKIKSVKLPSKNGIVDITIGYDTAHEAANGDAYIGAICGRVANRIGNGTFALNGKTYKLNQNDRTNTLHGGPDGFNNKVWNVESYQYKQGHQAYKLSLVSPDGDENFPGELKVDIIYALNNNNEFIIDIKAVTNQTTVVNITSHPYFNLNGINGGKVFNHNLQINANSYTPLNPMGVPTGNIDNIQATDLDFNTAKRVGDVVSSNYAPIHALGGLDHNWVINKKPGELAYMAKVTEPESGRSIEVYSTQPGLQVYTAMHFDGSETGKGGIPFSKYCGIALEAQNFPDAPNKPNFPSCVLNVGDEYHEQIIYKFGF